jgi:hypothetical protein
MDGGCENGQIGGKNFEKKKKNFVVRMSKSSIHYPRYTYSKTT